MDKPSVFVTRRWPEIAEKELKKYDTIITEAKIII